MRCAYCLQCFLWDEGERDNVFIRALVLHCSTLPLMSSDQANTTTPFGHCIVLLPPALVVKLLPVIVSELSSSLLQAGRFMRCALCLQCSLWDGG